MAGDLDDIRITIDCPACGEEFSERYGELRRHRRVRCRCGASITVDLSQHPIVAVDMLVQAEGKTDAANDNG